MPRRKSSLGRMTAQAKRSRLARSGETPEHRQARLEENRDRNSQRRAEETPEERAARLENVRLRVSRARQSETPEKREARLGRLRASVSLARDTESLEERRVRLEVNRERTFRTRQAESAAQRERRLAADRARYQLRWAIKERQPRSKRSTATSLWIENKKLKAELEELEPAIDNVEEESESNRVEIEYISLSNGVEEDIDEEDSNSSDEITREDTVLPKNTEKKAINKDTENDSHDNHSDIMKNIKIEIEEFPLEEIATDGTDNKQIEKNKDEGIQTNSHEH